MKIKVEFEINIDLNEMLKKYGKEKVEKFYYKNPKIHFEEIEKFLKNGVKPYCTIDITNLEISKGYFKNGEYIFDEAIFTEIL